MSNDGLLLWHLWRREPGLNRQLAVAALVGSSYAGLRPRKWDGLLLEHALATTDDSLLDCSAFLLAYSHHLDADRPERARTLLYACLDKLDLLSQASQQQVCREAAYFEARYAQNAAQAQQWLTRAQQLKPLGDAEDHFTRAEVAWMLGDYTEAQTQFRLAEAGPLVLNANDAGSRVLALDRMVDLRARLATAPATTATM